MGGSPLGLIAGDGRLPLEMARGARRAGRPVLGLGLRGVTAAELADEVDALHWFALGQVDPMLDALRGGGVEQVVLAGKVSKLLLLTSGSDAAPFEPDARALAALAALPDQRDDSILGAVAGLLEREGFELLPQADLVPELVPGPGPLGRHRPDARAVADAAFGWRAAKALAALDAGQCAVVRDRAVLALEAVEGTDEAIRRAGALAGPGASVVKVAKPSQDPRFDLPALGAGTLERAAEAGAVLIAFEAGRTLVLDRAALIERADAAGIAVVGYPAEGPRDPGSGRSGGSQGMKAEPGAESDA